MKKNDFEQPWEQNMYSDTKIARQFAEREQNEKHRQVAQIVDLVIREKIKGIDGFLQVAELGGGARIDRYDYLFARLLNQNKGGGIIDWVDSASPMLEVAKECLALDEFKERSEVVNFVQEDIIDYLSNYKNQEIDAAIMKYVFESLPDLEKLFFGLKKALAKNGFLVATLGFTKPEVPSYSTNAQFLLNGRPIPNDETRELKDGDKITIKFFNRSLEPGEKLNDFSEIGFLPGAIAHKYYHSSEKIKQLAKQFGFQCKIADWKNFIPEENQEGIDLNQGILILEK